MMRSATLLNLLALATAVWTVVSYSEPAQAQPLVTGDLVLYYDFDEIVSNQFLDESGNDYHGDIHEEFAGTGTLTLEGASTARGAGAARFDQSTDDLDNPVYIDGQGKQITDDGNVPDTAITLAAWVNLEETGSDQSIWQARAAGGSFQTHYQVQGNGRVRLTLREGGACCTDIVSEQRFKDGATDAADPTADFNADGTVNGPDQLEWQRGNGDANGDTVTDGADLAIWGGEFGASGNGFDFGEWVHVAGTWDMASNTWAMYYNGVQVATGAASGDPSMLLGDWGSDVDITGDLFAAGTGAVMDSGGRRTQGLMDELYIFGRALSAEEVATLALIPQSGAALSTVPEPTSLVLLGLASLAAVCRQRRR